MKPHLAPAVAIPLVGGSPLLDSEFDTEIGLQDNLRFLSGHDTAMYGDSLWHDDEE